MSLIRSALQSVVVVMISFLAAHTTHTAWGQDVENGAPPKADAPIAADELALRQSQLADRFAHLEKMMFRLAEYDVSEKPRRSALLRQALRQSRDRYIAQRFESLVDLLNQQQLSTAVKSQAELRAELNQLLELLMTENRPDRLKSEQQRVKDYIKEVDRILRLQRSVQGRTEGGEATDRLSRDQSKVAERTGELRKTIEENEQIADGSDDEEGSDGRSLGDEPEKQSEGQPGDQPAAEDSQSPGDNERSSEENNNDNESDPSKGSPTKNASEPGDKPSSDASDSSNQGQPNQGEGQQSEGQPSQGQPSQGQPSQGQPSQGQPSQGQPSQGQPSQGQPSQGQPGDSDPQQARQQDFPGRQKIAEAEEKMREAQHRLAEAKREGAVKEQEEARRLLEEAKAELEEILRQLREEEIERMLALLEGRFRKMLEMQLRVYENTKRLDRIPIDQRGREIGVQAGKLSLEERRIVAEADKALALLREEASSVAFPEVVQQMRDDMQQVVGLLSKARIGRITQGLQEDIIGALEEMIEALQQAQQDQEERQQQQQQSPSGGGEQDQGLVDAIAELKLIKSLQLRVNKRTQRYSRLLDDPEEPVGQLIELELVQEIRELSHREQRIVQTTRDIVLGRNK